MSFRISGFPVKFRAVKWDDVMGLQDIIARLKAWAEHPTEILTMADAKNEMLVEIIKHIVIRTFIDKNPNDIMRGMDDVIHKNSDLFLGILLSRIHRDDRIKILTDIGMIGA